MSKEAYIPQPKNCDVCKFEFDREFPAQYDARMKNGQWANLCESHWRTRTDQRLGTGYGQRLIVGEPEPKSDDEIKSEVMAALEAGDMDAAFDACGDRDPMEFL